jgi:4-amino-4-deoxy-L-arabinose transferase-like glycosyltransferase
MKSFLKKIKAWQLLLFLILVAAAFLRLFNLEDSLMFQADQGRDAIVVAKIFKEMDPVFIGPVTSIGNMYLGPFYYYFMLPFLMISYPSPVGPAYGVAVLGILTVFLVFKITKKLFDKKTALIAALFFALSSTVIEYSRFSWNPNIAPFFGLLMFYFTYLAWKKDSKYWLLVSLSFSLLIQLHYVALLSLGGAGIILLLQIFEQFKAKKRNKAKNKKLIIHVLLSILIFLISLTPLMLFDLKHDFRNIKSMAGIFTEEESFDISRKKGRTQRKRFSATF